MKIEINELDALFLLNYVVSAGMLLVGLLWDYIGWKFQIRYSPGYSYGQIFWLTGWAMYAIVTWYYARHYGK